MKKNNEFVPVNRLPEDVESGLFVEKSNLTKDSQFQNSKDSHRHDYHIFLLVQSGKLHVEIDFNSYVLESNSIIYIHPSQIHRIIKTSTTSFYSLGITNDNISSEYLRQLEQSVLPSSPLNLGSTITHIFFESFDLCNKLFHLTNNAGLNTFVKDACNSFIGLYLSEYLRLIKEKENINRHEMITRAFRQLLEVNFVTMKKPSDYAMRLNISPIYLRECVRLTSGLSVSEHIQNRIILEAKRMLYHSEKSVKEISVALGYEDYSYFSRLFKKIVGITALEFRKQNVS